MGDASDLAPVSVRPDSRASNVSSVSLDISDRCAIRLANQKLIATAMDDVARRVASATAILQESTARHARLVCLDWTAMSIATTCIHVLDTVDARTVGIARATSGSLEITVQAADQVAQGQNASKLARWMPSVMICGPVPATARVGGQSKHRRAAPRAGMGPHATSIAAMRRHARGGGDATRMEPVCATRGAEMLSAWRVRQECSVMSAIRNVAGATRVQEMGVAQRREGVSASKDSAAMLAMYANLVGLASIVAWIARRKIHAMGTADVATSVAVNALIASLGCHAMRVPPGLLQRTATIPATGRHRALDMGAAQATAPASADTTSLVMHATSVSRATSVPLATTTVILRRHVGATEHVDAKGSA
eukprot:2379147-Rhodomonas_salina.2